MKIYNKRPPEPPTDSVQRKLDQIVEKQAYLDGCIRTISESLFRIMDKVLELKGEIQSKK